jgi:hypothetical protein
MGVVTGHRYGNSVHLLGAMATRKQSMIYRGAQFITIGPGVCGIINGIPGRVSNALQCCSLTSPDF